ncbi:MAG: pseudouridine synthase [Anaerococcus sp.]|nr:pseudouridine synthase [Anaerococcus sp.]
MRINKYIAKSGYSSRRKADGLIKESRVKVNGKLVKEPGLNISQGDLVEVDGKILSIEEKFYMKVYKPVGFITSNYDPHNTNDLNDLVDLDKRFFAAGRLDKDSHGLLIITNDGDFTNKLTHPSNKLDKVYIVRVDKKLSKGEQRVFSTGIDLGKGEFTSKAKIKLIDYETNTYRVVIHQGYNRQIRRMFAYFSVRVKSLKRISIGPISLQDMKAYETRYFNEEEMKFVKSLRG